MPLFLETYTLPHDLAADHLITGLRRVNRGTNVRMLRCAYSLTDGFAWCLTEAPSADAVQQASMKMDFPFTLDSVTPVDSAAVLDQLPNLNGTFEPVTTRIDTPATTAGPRG
ncbi:MAG: hypothetical protein ACYDCQ_15235 [Dehalococcoidia bacterium]